jgi:hypothetical protein
MEVLATEPSLRHEWRNEPTRAVLYFPATTPQGFDVALAASDTDIELEAGGFHSPFDDNPDPEDFIRHALGLVRDLLSPKMRLRELLAGQIPYRWYLESRHGDAWVVEEEMGLLLWPYWSRRSERIFVNNTLPPRSE